MQDYNIGGANYNAKRFEKAALEVYYNIDPSMWDKDTIIREVLSLQRQLKEQLALLGQQGNSLIPTFSDRWFARSIKHRFPEVINLDVQPTEGRTMFTLSTSNAPLEMVYRGENCFYRSPCAFGYGFTFGLDYAWFINLTDWVSEKISGVRYSPGTHPHAMGDNGAKFSHICTGNNNPFFHRLQRGGKESAEQLKSMIVLALKWLRTYNINDAYHAVPTLSTGSVCLTPSNIVHTLEETEGFEYKEFKLLMVRALFKIHKVLTEYDTSNPRRGDIDELTGYLNSLHGSVLADNQALIGLQVAHKRLMSTTEGAPYPNTMNQRGYAHPYLAIWRQNSYLPIYGAWVGLYQTVYAWVMLMGAFDSSIAPARVGSGRSLFVHDLLYPTREYYVDYDMDAYMTAMCAKNLTPEDLPVTTFFKHTTDTLPNLQIVMNEMVQSDEVVVCATGSVGAHIMAQNIPTN